MRHSWRDVGEKPSLMAAPGSYWIGLTGLKIVGKDETNVITGGESTAAAEAKTEGKTEEDEFTEDEVIELIQETLQYKLAMGRITNQAGVHTPRI